MWITTPKSQYYSQRYAREAKTGCVMVLSILIYLSIVVDRYYSVKDIDIVTGTVTTKHHYIVPCEHEYVCGVSCSGSGKNRSCSPRYCNEHPYDVDWVIDTTIGNIPIHRVDSQGIIKPPLWSKAVNGEIATLSKSTENYTKLMKDSYTTSDNIKQKYINKIPNYPTVYDYYKFNHVINTTDSDYSWVNPMVLSFLKNNAYDKQINIVVVITNYSSDYYYAVMDKWDGPKKNDLIMFFGVNNEAKVQWFKAITFANGQSNSILLDKLRVNTIGKELSTSLIADQLSLVKNEFHRLRNSNFIYLILQWTPSTLLICMSCLVLSVLSWCILFLIKFD